MAIQNVEAVEGFRVQLGLMLELARATNATTTVEPALSSSDFSNFLEAYQSFDPAVKAHDKRKAAQYAVIETAVRDRFNELLATATIEDEGFVNMWNLLDIVSITADEEKCDPALLFWLVEELLDSQTIAGCRKVFDYLESRRERITSKHFAQKNLVILRSCNELLRRLSRAEDTAFCGRVFIFMFQSFPLGDKSSVNLRGEYHVENVTSFDDISLDANSPKDPMEVDAESKDAPVAPAAELRVPSGPSATSKSSADPKNPKSVTFDSKKPVLREKPIAADELYPIFWSLQQSFSQPKRLFEPVHFATFKKGLETTMATFQSVQAEQQSRGSTKSAEEGKRGTKRKREVNGDDELLNAFNPKYLTSRDLFELEISDLSFRRHIAVQALIILDFMLSLSSKAKEKSTTIATPNKSVMYIDQTLSEEDTKWALDTKRSIADYLKKGYEGPFFHRMVETVLSRDKNWVRWKMENCPSIAKPAVSSDEYLAAKVAAKKATANKRIRPHPMASLDLKFLIEAEGSGGMEKLKTSRYRIPTLEDFRRKIADDDFEIEMPASDESKQMAVNGKASKSWRALRIASKTNLAKFDKIDDPEKIDIIFQEATATEEEQTKDEVETGDDNNTPTDRRPLIISGPGGVGKGTLIKILLEKHPNMFRKKSSHTTRAPREGEVDGVDYNFVDTETYNMMRDGDQFLEFNCLDGNDYGTSRKIVEGIVAAGKVPVMAMDYHGIQQLKDQSYQARFVFVTAPSIEELERRIRSCGTDTDGIISARLEVAKEEIKQAENEGFYDITIINDDLDKSYGALEEYIFKKGDREADSSDVAMVDANTVVENATETVNVDMANTVVADGNGEGETEQGSSKEGVDSA